jgi:hypothetical protein
VRTIAGFSTEAVERVAVIPGAVFALTRQQQVPSGQNNPRWTLRRFPEAN